MLKFINITNYVVIQDLSLELGGGLNLLTGETGAGKSIIVDALGLLLGGRSTGEIIRRDEKRCVLECGFELEEKQRKKVESLLNEIGVQLDVDEELLIRREFNSSGRGRVLINDQAVTVSFLKSIQPLLLDILGQSGQQTLASTRAHLELLDSFAGCLAERHETTQAFAELKRVRETLSRIRRDKSERARLTDYLRFQIDEIEAIDPRPREDVEIISERKLLVNAEKALELISRSHTNLYEGEQSVLTQLASVRRDIEELSSIDPRVAEWIDSTEQASAILSDVADELRGYGQRFNFSPERLAQLEARLIELERLKRKYGVDFEGIIKLKGQLREQLEHLDSLDIQEQELESSVEKAELEYLSKARRLSEIRRGAAKQFAARVTEECGQLALERARFVVSLATESVSGKVDQEGEEGRDQSLEGIPSGWTPYGIDRVEFLFSANEGEPERPLASVASGGELSRLMLALRTVCNDSRMVSPDAHAKVSLVFDEIDAGIGGRAAEAVGRRLKALAAQQQVLCVTHQPQIARFADHHFKIVKVVEKGRTKTKVEFLGEEARVGELARMIGGAENIEAARGAARWMLDNSEMGGKASRSKRRVGS